MAQGLNDRADTERITLPYPAHPCPAHPSEFVSLKPTIMTITRALTLRRQPHQTINRQPVSSRADSLVRVHETDPDEPLKPNPVRLWRSSLTDGDHAYLESIIPAELSQIVTETNGLHSQHSAFSQLALNRTVEHCCGLLNMPYSSQSNQSKKAETLHKQNICMDNIIDFFGIVKPATFANHRGTHFLALNAVQLLETHGDVLEVKDARYLKHLKDVLLCNMNIQAWHLLDRSLGQINGLRKRVKEIMDRCNP